MTCYHPNYLVQKKLDSLMYLKYKYEEKNGVLYKHLKRWKLQKNKPFLYRFISSGEVNDKTSDYWKFIDDPSGDYSLTPLPCGCCVGCRLDYSRQWANRCYLESTLYKDNYFITLTYDDDHVPFSSITSNLSLNIDDFTKFMKDLRRYFKYHFNLDNIRFYGCGEYGDTSLRPHYHILVFNLPIPDLSLDFPSIKDGNLIISRHSASGELYYYSDIIHKIWNKGNVIIGKVSWQSCAYVARYVMKKQKGNNKGVYESLDIVPEFVRMSRNPGIGIPYYNLHKDEIYENDNVLIYHNGASYVSPPRAFDKKYEIDYPAFFNDIKIVRKDRQDEIINTFDKTYSAHFEKALENKENLKKASLHSLKRII